MKEVTLRARLGFLSFIGGQKLLYILISSYASIYYITYVKIDPVIVAMLLLSTRMFDAFNDPIIGFLMEKSSIKLKKYINYTAILLPVATLFIFKVPIDMGMITIGYVVITYVLWSLLYTISEVPIYSIVSRMTKNKDEQNTLFANSQIGSIVGMVLGLMFIAFFISKGVDNINWNLMSLSISALGLIQMSFAVFFIKEKYTKKKNQSQTLLKGIKQSFSNKDLYTIMIIYLAQLFINASTVLSIYVFDGYYHLPSLGSIIGLISIFSIIPLSIFLPFFVKKIGKTNIIYIACGLMVFSNIIALLTNSLILMIFCLVISMMGVLIPSLLRPMYTQECIDSHYVNTGAVNETTAFSIQTFFNKAGDAIGSSLGVLLLGVVGYDATLSVAEQSYEFLILSRFIYFSGPILMGISWFIGIRYFYKLKNPKHLEILNTQMESSYE